MEGGAETSSSLTNNLMTRTTLKHNRMEEKNQLDNIVLHLIIKVEGNPVGDY